MDCRYVCVLQLMCALLAVLSHFGNAIVGRHLLLTPKQELQHNGRSIYYKEDHAEQASLRNQSMPTWERTLKHVTFVTLFTNAAAGAAAGNMSKLQEYGSFLRTPYIRQRQTNDVRFGDIVTLARGRLDASNGSYRFVEGQCDYDCEPSRVWALWQVQKIRHREMNGKFRYEMKFSVCPLRADGGGDVSSNNSGSTTIAAKTTNTKRDADEGVKFAHYAVQTYIQKEDDYPQNFGRIVHSDEQSFADRRLDAAYGNYNQVTPMPQSTFAHGIFQPPPPPSASQQQLNIGEYLKDFRSPPTAGKPAFDHYTNTFRLGMGRNHLAPPTTYRPQHHYQLAFPRPELYKPPSDLGLRYTIQRNPPLEHHRHEGTFDAALPPTSQSPLVAHHYHHHFITPSSSAENGMGAGLAEELPSVQDLPTGQAPNYYVNRPPYANEDVDESDVDYKTSTTPRDQGSQPPAPHKVSFPQPMLSVLQQQHVVRVSPVPPLRRPTTYQAGVYGGLASLQLYPKVPLQVYAPPPVVEYTTPARHKPFLQSEPLRMVPIRYSDPDPLYIGVDESHEVSAPQLEAPKTHFYSGYGKGATLNTQRPNSIAAQLPQPDKDRNVRIPYVNGPTQFGDSDETTEQGKGNQHKQDLQQHPSQKAVHVSTEQTTATTPRTETPPENTTLTTMATTSNEISTLQMPATTDNDASSSRSSTVATNKQSRKIATTPKPATSATPSFASSVDSREVISNFISTSSSQTPLRSLSRYRATYNRIISTTERPVLKWKPRRKTSAKTTDAAKNTAHDDNKAKSSVRHEATVPVDATANVTAANSSTSVAAAVPRPSLALSLLPQTLRNQRGNEMFEVLTQKSVSRSISIKVGRNGEEIPIIIDDADDDDSDGVAENEVPRA